MRSSPDRSELSRAKQILEWLGLICWLLIIPVKLLRWTLLLPGSNLTDILPSILGPAGLMLVLFAWSIECPGLSPLRATGVALFMALGVEFAQLLPRPGILEKIHYTFDWSDVIATVVSIITAFFLSKLIMLLHTVNKSEK